MKQIIFILCLLYSLQAHSCMRSESGEQYDKLIKIVQIEDNKYRVTVPTKIGLLTSSPIIKLRYNGSTMKQIIENPNLLNQKIELVKGDNEFVGMFYINNKLGTEQSIDVYWPPLFGCGLIASQPVPVKLNYYQSTDME